MAVRYVCSFGSHCHTGKILQRNNLKLASYPFDWIFSNPDMILHCIETGFSIFLDKSYYKIPPNHLSGKKCIHAYYSPTVTFNHHNPLLKDDYSYVTRCVDRFKVLMQKPELKLFLMISVNNTTPMSDELTETIRTFNKQFANHTTNYKLCYIHHIIQNVPDSHTITREATLDFLQFTTKESSSGTKFSSEQSNLYMDKLLKSLYTFELIDIQQNNIPAPLNHTRRRFNMSYM
jgi:hypothetical protein